MEPTCYRVARPDDHLGLQTDEILIVSDSGPDGISIAWPRPRRLPPNYGYLVGLLAVDAIVPIHPANLSRYLADVAALSTRSPSPLPPPDQTTTESVLAS